MSTGWSTDVKLYTQRARSLSALSSRSQELRGKELSDPFHPSVVPTNKKQKTKTQTLPPTFRRQQSLERLQNLRC